MWIALTVTFIFAFIVMVAAMRLSNESGLAGG